MFNSHMFNFISPSPAFIADKRRFCSGHAQGDMVNIHNKKCQALGCTKQPVFRKGGQQASMCATHKSNGMRNVNNRICADPSCTKQPSYGFSGEAKKLCAPHKLDGMINIKSQHSLRCSFPACTKCPSFGFPGGDKPSLLTPGGGHDRRSDPAGQEKHPAKSGEQSAEPVLSPADASDESFDNTVEAVGDGGKRFDRNVWPRPPPPSMPPRPQRRREQL